MEFPGSSSVTSKLRTSVLTVRNSTAGPTGTSDVYGVLSSGTGTLGPASFSFNSLKGSTINVYSNGAGKKRGILVDNSNIVTTRDLNVYVAAPTDVTSTGSYVGCEVNDRNGATGTGSIQFRSTTLGTTTPVAATGPTGTIQAYTASDIFQSTPTAILNPAYLASPGIQVGPGTDLVTKTAGGKGFSTYVYPTTIYYGLKGDLTSGTNGWLWPGTQAVSTGVFPDSSGTDGNLLLTVSGCTSGGSPAYQITTSSTAGLAAGMPIVFSDNYGYIKEGAVLGVPAVSPYYIFDVPDSNHIRIGTYVANTLTVFNPGTYSSSQTVATVYTTTVTATSYNNNTSSPPADRNKITLSSTTGLTKGMPIVFQSVIGGTVSVGTVYYIAAVSSPTITISATFNGPVFALTGSGSLSPSVTGNVVTISSAPAYYRIQQPAILSGMAAFLAIPPNTNGATGSSTTVTIYRTPVGSDYQFGLCPVANYTKTFSGTDLLETYYDSSKTFSAGDRIHAFLSYTSGATGNSSHDFTLQLDMF
jgi:hypothetical protein